MSDSELQEHFMKLDNLVDHQGLNDELQSLDDLLGELQEEEEAAPVKTPEPRCFLQDLQHSLSDTSDDEASPLGTSRDPLLASSSWSTRQSFFSERWRAESPRLVNTAAAQENVATRICQQCGSNPAAVRCGDCRPRPFYCAECDVSMHTRHVLHNRDAMTPGFYQPLPPTTFVVDKALSHCGRYDLSMPELNCEACQDTWAAGVVDLNRSDYWPATLHFATIYATDVFFSFEEMKMAEPGLSCQAFVRILDQRTVRFGRTGKISTDSFQKSFFEWEALRYEVDKICKEEPFICPARTPDMLAVSVDGNRKHYRFKNAARSEEQAIFKDVFIAKDEDVTRFVDYIHKTSKHVSGRGVCGGEWSAARETSQRSASKVDEEDWSLRIEVLVASIKRRSQRLYKDTDGNKGRARIRRRIREEKGILTSVVEKYNRMVPNTETLCLKTILSESHSTIKT
ncbi:hypothetical protein G5714_024335 [Onychostoma macrolepis]|uniref:CxC3 like cysteine cluster domain-containing protein n=1 Tax=Onychostoma macrolepis TaxID=369639 RepID=A0A7J6BJF8_9TELE|nr:hypothetical protein G5714_024335 [Onychostoma macrolepis]